MNAGRGTKIMIILADYLMIVVGMAILVGAFFKNWTLSGEMISLISTSNGIFLKCIADFHSFEFGSSRASQQKDQTIANFTTQPAPVAIAMPSAP